MSAPSHTTRPWVGRVTVAMMRISVDLPAPLGPSNPRIPGPTSRVNWSSARTPPRYCFETDSISSRMTASRRVAACSRAYPTAQRAPKLPAPNAGREPRTRRADPRRRPTPGELSGRQALLPCRDARSRGDGRPGAAGVVPRSGPPRLHRRSRGPRRGGVEGDGGGRRSVDASLWRPALARETGARIRAGSGRFAPHSWLAGGVPRDPGIRGRAAGVAGRRHRGPTPRGRRRALCRGGARDFPGGAVGRPLRWHSAVRLGARMAGARPADRRAPRPTRGLAPAGRLSRARRGAADRRAGAGVVAAGRHRPDAGACARVVAVAPTPAAGGDRDHDRGRPALVRSDAPEGRT